MTKIDQLLNDYNKIGELTPGISLAVIKDEKCILKKSHGFANLEHQAEVNSKTAFYLASLSKSFTAAAIILLCEQGKLDLFDKINGYFKELPDCCEDVRIINLVNHTSGLKDYINSYVEKQQNIKDITNNDVYQFILNEGSLKFSPGEKFEYSNTGYVLLSLLIEKMSKQSYADFLRENFFEPLNMKNTYVFTENKPVIPNRSYGYKQISDTYFCNDYYLLTTGDGGIYSCIDDLILWVQAFDNESFFSRKTIEKIFSVEKLNDGSSCKYAFGWFTAQKNDQKVVFHTGGLAGFTNIMVKLLDNKFSVIILSNYYKDSFQEILEGLHSFVIETDHKYGTVGVSFDNPTKR